MRASPWDTRVTGARVRSERRGAQRFPSRVQLANDVAVASTAPMAVMPGRCQNASKSSVGCCHAREALDRGRFGGGALSASGTREPHGCSEVDWIYRAGRSANLKTCKQLRATYFYEACTSATRADATGVKAPARHPSQCSDPKIRCSMGNVPSTIASSALPPGRLIGCVLSGGCAASRATRRHAERSHRAHHSHAGRNNFEKQNGQHRSGRCVDGSGSSLTRIELQHTMPT